VAQETSGNDGTDEAKEVKQVYAIKSLTPVTAAIMITLCALLLLAYFFDITSRRTRIPSVILLLALGWCIQQALDILGVELPDMSGVLPGLGTVGLILIVLEGALELELNPSKKPVLLKAVTGAGFSVLLISLAAGALLHFVSGYSLKDCVSSVLPLSVISSSIAIPSARNLDAADREFVVYESSMSDILGVVMFNFVVLNEVINALAFLSFGAQLLIMAAISLAGSFALTYMLRKIQHPVRFIPMILWVVLLYELTKLYNLPGLLFILVFGLVLGNLEQLNRIPVLRRFSFVDAKPDVGRFHELTGEIAFLVRSLFFLLFGYTLQTAEILDTSSLFWSFGLVAFIFLIRAVQLRVSRLPLLPLLFIAPRGLITILLFLSLPEAAVVPDMNRSVLTQVIVLTSLVMMVGMMVSPSQAGFRRDGESM
jgi:hypothetical protein